MLPGSSVAIASTSISVTGTVMPSASRTCSTRRKCTIWPSPPGPRTIAPTSPGRRRGVPDTAAPSARLGEMNRLRMSGGPAPRRFISTASISPNSVACQCAASPSSSPTSVFQARCSASFIAQSWQVAFSTTATSRGPMFCTQQGLPAWHQPSTSAVGTK
jgi:hypothetical protein